MSAKEDNLDSGESCRHWDDPAYCEIRCAHCGHLCRLHDYAGCDECDCAEWVEPE